MTERHPSKCPHADCTHTNWREVKRVQGSHTGAHVCAACKREYSEHYRVSVVIETYEQPHWWAEERKREAVK